MDPRQARNLIKEIFEQPFDKARFIVFIKNLLNKVDESKAFHARGDVKESFSNVIKTYERVCSYVSPNGEKIDVLIVYLQKTFSIHHARVTQRNFAGKYLADRGQKDAGLFAFVSPDDADWRFSLVKMDYRFEETPTGKIKVKEEFTPARRWSFLVGVNEKSHTAQSRLVEILADDENNPTLSRLEDAFNIETVSKEFFLKYRDLFIRTKEALDKVVRNDKRIKDDFEAKDVNTVDFSKKLLGQIVFLYFLQKKGWFGAGRDADWGDGSRHFLRELFEKKHGDFNNFFNDILEPLFYEALRNDRSHDDDYYSRFNCRIPFLNGGLFDPIGNYDWVHTDIRLPDVLFSNKTKTKEGDTGDGILDVFDRYNFTVKEDEPLEKEVAIDPELLGKTYEKFNAIRPDNFDVYKKALKSGKRGDESKFNKQFGVYYTPREIVHYMCQQSLINYLFSELNKEPASFEKIGEDNFSMFGNEVKKGQFDLITEHRQSPMILKQDIEKLIYSGENVSENEATAIIKQQRINDGIQQSTKIKHIIPESIRINADIIDKKLEEITVCDPAVGSGAFPVGMMSEIVKTRSVLSMFINPAMSRSDTDIESRTAYNFKRQCIEHSLYGVDIDPGAVEIAKLRLWLSLVVDEEDIKNIKPLPNLDYKIVCGNSLIGVKRDLLNDYLFKELEKLKPIYFNETHPTNKQNYRKKIDDQVHQITNGHKEFDFEVYFSEVFHQNGGFDVIIANPPYVLGRNTFSKELKQYLSSNYDAFGGKYDLYIYFTEKAISLLKPGGTIIYIIPNTILANENAKRLRKLILDRTNLNIIRVFEEMVFSEAQVESVIIEVSKKPTHEQLVVVQIGENIQLVFQDAFSKNKDFRFNVYSSSSTESLINKIITQSELLGNLSDICIGIQLGGSSGSGTKESFLSGTSKNKTYKKVLDGKNINYYSTVWGGSFVRYGNWLHRRRDEKYFLNPKIMIRQIGTVPVATYDEEKYYTLNTIYNLINSSEYSLKYFLAIINSKPGKWFWHSQNSDFKNLFPKIKKTQLENIPIHRINFSSTSDKKKHDNLVSLVDRIIAVKCANPSSDTCVLESQINGFIYKLYDFTEEEIKIVEGNKI